MFYEWFYSCFVPLQIQNSIWQSLELEVVKYSFQSSFFDIFVSVNDQAIIIGPKVVRLTERSLPLLKAKSTWPALMITWSQNLEVLLLSCLFFSTTAPCLVSFLVSPVGLCCSASEALVGHCGKSAPWDRPTDWYLNGLMVICGGLTALTQYQLLFLTVFHSHRSPL